LSPDEEPDPEDDGFSFAGPEASLDEPDASDGVVVLDSFESFESFDDADSLAAVRLSFL